MKEQQLQHHFTEERPLMREGHPLGSLYKLLKEVDELIETDRDEPTPEELEEMGFEAADVFNYLADYCNRRGLDLGYYVPRKVERNYQRFPKELFDGSNGGTYMDGYRESKAREGKPVVEPVDIYTPSISAPENDHFQP